MANGLFGGIIWASQEATGGGIRGTVNTFNDLPAAIDHPNEMWVVLETTRVPLLDWHSKGLYYSNGSAWDYKGASPDIMYTDVFRIVDPTSTNKQLAFNLSSQSTTTRTITSADRDLNLQTPIFNSVTFDTTAVDTPVEGKVYWNSEDGTLNVGMPGGNVNLQLGQEMHLRARNVEGTTILNGQAVRVAGASSAIPQVVLVNNLEELSPCTIAIATEDVPNNQRGYFTTEGFVRGINTSLLTEGSVIWLGNADGSLTTTPPTNPSQSIKMGYCIRQHATQGVIYVSIQSKELFRDRQITKEPTGFASSPTVSYDSTTRRITLTGSVEAYYQGQRMTALVPGWTSPVHDAIDGAWYLFYDGTNFVWQQTPWDFPALQIAFVRYSTTGRFGLTEAHGFMPWSVHRHLHANIGTYLTSGGDLSSFTVNSTTAGNRRPAISQTNIMDEDNASTLDQLNTALYTQRYLVGAGANITYNVDASDILPLSGNTPFYNQFTGGAWQQTLFPTNAYGAVFVMAVPVTADATSQKFRYMFIQPQTVSTTLATIQNLTPASLNMGESAGTVSEYVFIAKIIVRFTAGNWVLTSVEKLTGNRILQVSSSTGNFLSAVSTNDNLSGAGTAGSPLRLTGKITPTADSTTAIQFMKADGVTQVGAFDTTTDGLKVGNVDSGVTSTFEAQGNNASITITSLEAYDAGLGGTLAFRGRATSAGNFGGFGSMNVFKENTSSGDFRSYMTFRVRNTTGLFDWAKITSNGFVGLTGITDPQNFLHIKTRYNAGSSFNGAMRIENWTSDTFGMIDHIIGGFTFRNNGIYGQSGTVIPKSTEYSQVTLGSGTIQFFTNSGLVIDTPFNPIERMSIGTSGLVKISSPSTTGGIELFNINTIGTQASGNYADLSFKLGDISSRGAVIRAISNGGPAGNGHSLAFLTSANGAVPTEAMRISSTNKLSVGYADNEYSAITAEFKDNLYVTGNTLTPILGLTRFKGTRNGTYSAIVTNDGLGQLDFGGTFGTANSTTIGATIGAVATGDWSSITAKPTDLVFFTSPTSGAITERMRINSAGSLGLGTTAPQTVSGFSYTESTTSIIGIGGKAIGALNVSGTTSAVINLVDTGATANARWYQIGSDGGNLSVLLTADNGGSSSNFFQITSTGNVILGSQSALATSATNGFAYLPTCAGAPTGAATSYTGKVPFVVDTTNNRLYIRVGSTWRYATLT